LLAALTDEGRVLIIGGLAVILHGLTRHTKDADVWLEPMASPTIWSAAVARAAARFPETYFWDLSRREKISAAEIAECAEAVHVVRIAGIEPPVDVFREPSNLKAEDFEEAWTVSHEVSGEQYRIIHEADLIVTKLGTTRVRDVQDIGFLEGRIRAEFGPILTVCDLVEARRLFGRYVDHETCRAALANPHAEVRALAVESLRALAAAENPFAQEMLTQLGEA